MNRSKALTVASVPATLGLAWHQYRRAVRAVDAHPAVAPNLPGELRQIASSWGSITYRFISGDPDSLPLVLVHGWGSTADSSWWPIAASCCRTMAVVDLPGHGPSRLEEPFTFEIAAEAVIRVIEDAGLDRPLLAAHSMGGPVAFTAVRKTGAGMFSGLVLLATSAYWVRPRLRLMMAMAPYVMASRSPILIHRHAAELRQFPDLAQHLAWSYTQRPFGRLLHEAAVALRCFDARGWDDLVLPTTTWVVASRDRILAPSHQHASAQHFGADVVELDVEHSLVTLQPEAVLEILERTPGPAKP